MSYSTEVLADSPYIYWKGDDASGNIADSSGNSRTGTANGTITYSSAGYVNNTNSLYLNDSGFITWTTTSTVSGNFSVELWFKCDAVSKFQNLFSGYGGSASGQAGALIYLNSTNGIEALARQNTATTSWAHVSASANSLVAADTWYHLVGVWNDSTKLFKLYLNNSEVISTSYSGVVARAWTSGQNIYIGSSLHNTTQKLDGHSQHIAIYTSALSAARIEAHYDAALEDPDATIDAEVTDIEIAGLDANVVISEGIYVSAPSTDIAISGLDAIITGEGGILVQALTASADIDAPKMSTYHNLVQKTNPEIYYLLSQPFPHLNHGSSAPLNNASTLITGMNNPPQPVTGFEGIEGVNAIRWQQYASNVNLTSRIRLNTFPVIDNWSFAMWIRPANGNPDILWQCQTTIGSPFTIRYTTTHGWRIRFGSTSTTNYTLTIPPEGLLDTNRWYHIAVTCSRPDPGQNINYIKLYLDGALRASGTAGDRIRLNTGGTNVTFGTTYDVGSIIHTNTRYDHFGIWLRELSSNDVFQLYAANPEDKVVEPSTASADVEGLDAEVSFVSHITVSPTPGSVSVEGRTHSVITPGSTIVGISPTEMTIEAYQPFFFTAGIATLYPNTATVFAQGLNAKLRLVTDGLEFKFVPGTDTSFTAFETDTLVHIHFGAGLHGSEKRTAFRLGNLSDVPTYFEVNAEGLNEAVLPGVEFSLDKGTWTPTVTTSVVAGNALSDIIYVRLVVPPRVPIGHATFTINVEQIDA